MSVFKLWWAFTNGHEWHKLFNTEDEAVKAALDFGLYTHPQMTWVEIVKEEN